MSSEATCERHVFPAGRHDPPDDHSGWQILAEASLGRRLSDAELAAAELLPAPYALDLLFPGLTDAARHEALSALG